MTLRSSVMVGVAVLAVSAALTLGPSQPALGDSLLPPRSGGQTAPPPPSTGPVTDTAPPFVVVAPGTGTDALLGGPDLRGYDRPTLTERFPSGAYSVDNTLGYFDASDRAVNALAGALFAVVVWIGRAAVSLQHWAFSTDLLAGTADAVDDVVGRLRNTLYLPLVLAMIVAAGAWILVHGVLRRRAAQSVEGAAWTLLALAAGALFLAQPGSMVRVANEGSVGAATGVLGTLAAADPGTGPADGAQTVASFSGDAATNELRIAGDRFFRTFVFMPWQVMEFGSVDAGSRPCGANTGAGPCAERLLEAKSASYLPGQPDPYGAVKNDLAHGPDREAWEWFQGHRATERLGVATLALVGVLVGGVLVIVICGAVLVAQLSFLLLVLLAPLFLLLGIHPGAGRVLALRWAALALSCLLRRVAYAALAGVLMVASGVLMAATARAGRSWLAAMSVQVLLVAAAFVHRRSFAALLSHASASAGLAAPAEARLERASRRGVALGAATVIGRRRIGRGLVRAVGRRLPAPSGVSDHASERVATVAPAQSSPEEGA